MGTDRSQEKVSEMLKFQVEQLPVNLFINMYDFDDAIGVGWLFINPMSPGGTLLMIFTPKK